MRSLNYKQKFATITLLCVMAFGNIVFADDANTLSVNKLIEKSYKTSEIDRNDYLMQTLRSYFEPSSLNALFKNKGLGNQATRRITPLLIEAKNAYDTLEENDQKFLDTLLRRPTDGNYSDGDLGGKFYLPAPVKVFEPTAADYPSIGGKFKFWYVDHNKTDAKGNTHQTTLAQVKSMASAFDNVYKSEITDMGYSTPPNDTGTAEEGGDTKFDIYSMDTGTYGIYGFVAPDKVSSDNEFYSFMVMDNDFVGFPKTPDESLKVTAAHEYHHAIQMGINQSADTWYMEATSTWMEEKVYDEVNDNRQYLKDILEHPEVSLDSATEHWYATWIFNEYLSTSWDNDIVKDIWTQLDPMGNDNAFDAIETVLATKSETLKSVYRSFWAKNYQKNNFYAEGNHWPAVKIENSAAPHTLDFSTATSNEIEEQSLTLKHMAAKLYKFKPGSTLFDKKTLTIQVTAAAGDEIAAMVIMKKKDGTYKEYTIDLDASGEGEAGVAGFGTESVDEVVLVIVNHSKTVDDIAVKYTAFLAKPITFVIDDTGSMGSEISAAKNAITTVLNTNKASGKHFFYTLLSYKDGPATLDGQSSDEDVMIVYANALYASGGAGCPESAFISVRQATELAENSDIYIMTDADSNSYGVDNTYASWGELWETVSAVLTTNSHVHAIIYGNCYRYDKSVSKSVNDSTQEDSCSPDDDILPRIMFKEYSSGIGGYVKLSGETGGLYFKATASTTEDITEIILNHSSADTTVLHLDGNDTSKTYTLPIDDSIEKFEVVVNVSDAVTATVQIKDPTGKIVSDGDAGVSSIEVSSSTFYLMSESAVIPGNWSIEVNATGNYRLASKGNSDNVLSYMGDTAVGIDGDLKIKLALGKEVSNLKFYLVNLEDDISQELTLTNIGLVYQGKVTMSKGGSYRLLVQGDDYFQRVYPSKIVVNEVHIEAPSSTYVNKGDNITYTFTIVNKSSVEATYNLFATSSEGWADLSSVPSSIVLAANAAEDILIDVNVSDTAANGTIDTLSLQVVDANNSLVRSTTSIETRIAVLYDLDEDGDVDVTDIMMVASKWGILSGETGYSLSIDLNDDGKIGIKDIMLVAAQWGWESV